MKLNIKKRKKGAALLIAILAGILLSILSVALLTKLTSELKTRQATEERIASKYAAEAGIEHGIFVYLTTKYEDLNSGSTYSDSLRSGSTVIGNYTVTIYKMGAAKPSGGTYDNDTLLSTAVLPSGRTMKIQAEINSSGAIISWQEIQ